MSKPKVMKRVAAAWRELTAPQRAAWRALTAGPRGKMRPRRVRMFSGAEESRLTMDWTPTRQPIDDDTRWTLPRLRARARDLDYNNATMRQFLRLMDSNVLGPAGVRFQARVRDNSGNLNKVINAKIEAAWADWMRRPTRDGKQSGLAFQRTVLRGIPRDGEQFVRVIRGFSRNPYGMALETIDPDLVDESLNRMAGTAEGNEIRLGVEVDGDGRPVAYHGWSRPLSSVMPIGRERIAYQADEVIHLYDQLIANQTRGLPWALPAILPLRMRGGYFEAELVAARVAASNFFAYEPVPNGEEGELDAEGAGASEDGEGSQPHFEQEANPGTGIVVPRGYKLSGFTPDHPSTAFSEFLKGSGREVSTALGTNYNTQFGDLENVNYSSIRAGLLSERDMWRTLQNWWIEAFLVPVFDEWLNWAVLTGALVLDTRDARRFRDCKWTPRGWPWVDPLKDIQASVLAIGHGLDSRTETLAEQGRTFEDVMEQLKEEQDIAAEYQVDITGAAVNAKAPLNEVAGGAETPTGDETGDSTNGTSNGTGRGHAVLHRK